MDRRPAPAPSASIGSPAPRRRRQHRLEPIHRRGSPRTWPVRSTAMARFVLVHGFTQTGRSWQPVARRLADAGHDVSTPDLPGHGARTGVRADLAETAELLADEGGPACYVGYSLGGRVCLHLALQRPGVVERLVLLST